MNDTREFMKGGANVHVKAHYRLVNGKLIYVHEHDKAGQIGTEAQLHERVQFGKNKAHLMAIDPEDRDMALKHAGQLGLKPEVKYQGGKIKNEAGESKAHGFHYLKFNSEEEAKKVHESIASASKAEKKNDLENEAAVEMSDDKSLADVHDEVINLVAKDLSSITDAIEGKGNPQEAIKKIDAIVEKLNHLKKLAPGTGHVAEMADNALEAWAERKTKLEGMVKTKGEEKPGDTSGVKEYPGTGKQAGVTVRVAKRKDGKFAVTMKDDDSGEVFPQAMVFPTEEWAHTYAQEIAAGKKPSGNTATTAKVESANEEEPKAEEKPAVDTASAKSNFMKVDPANILVDKDGKEWTRGAYSDSGTDLLPVGGGESKEFTWDQIASMGLKDTGKTDPDQDENQDDLKSLMQQADENLHKDPKAAIEALRQGAALAKQHGISYKHGNGKEFDADYMTEMADKLEAAMPKAPAVDEEYTQAAKQATEASGSAHEHTKKMAEAQKMGAYDAPDSHAGANSAHTEGDKLHGEATSAHEKAAEKAPTPELKQFHQEKAKEHAARGLVHQEAAKKHLFEHKKKQAQDTYDYELGKAEAASMGANEAKTNHTITDSHDMAADAHTDAAKQHTAMIQHALATGDDKAALKHSKIATEHQKKAAFHSSAKTAWKATVDAEAGHTGHSKAAALHSAAAQDAEDAGLKDAAEYHDKQANEHLDKHKAAKAHEPVHPNTKDAEEASDEAKDWSWTPNLEQDQHADAAKAHSLAQKKHLAASTTAHTPEQMKEHVAKSEHHGKMADYHKAASAAKDASDATEKFKPISFKHNSSEHAEAAQAHEKAAWEHEKLTGHNGIAGSQKHQSFHSEAAVHHHDMAEKHKQFSASEKKLEDQEKAEESKAQPSSSNQWKGKNSTQIVNLGHKAFNEGNYAEAIKHYKHAAVVAHHNGHTEDAATYVKNVQEAMDKMKQVQKALPSMPVSVQEAARQLHAQRQEPRNFAKAIKDLPAAGKLQKACADATKAGITDVHHIVEMAVGGKKSAAPYLAFLAGVNQ